VDEFRTLQDSGLLPLSPGAAGALTALPVADMMTTT
jgi:hypothetical protein